MASRTRLTDIAEKAGVSTATVSRVLNGKAVVAEDTRRSVLYALDVLGYERPEKLRSSTGGPIGVIIPELSNPVFPAFAQAIEQHLASQGFTPLLCTQSPGGIAEDQYIELLVQQRAQGIIFVAGLHADSEADTTRYHQLQANGVPFVLVNGANPKVTAPSFGIDEAKSMDLAVRHLASLGHRRIGLVTGQRRYSASRGKRDGFTAAMTDQLGVADPAIVSSFFGYDGGATGAATLLDQGCTAIVLGSDIMALGAIQHIHTRSLRVPEDVSIVGFDDSPLLAYTAPPLTTVRQPVAEIARSAAGTLIDLIHGHPVPRTELRFAPELIVRSTTGAAPTTATP